MSKRTERAFAVAASPAIIWRILLDEVREGVESGRATVIREEAPRQLTLDVRLGWGLGVRYTYEITLQPEHTEVAATVTPYGMRHAVANVISFGRAASPYLVALTQGLANLKQEAEREAARER